MIFLDYSKLASKNLMRRKVRTFLSILAVAVAALMVFVMISLAMGVQAVLTAELKKTGSLTQVTVRPAIEGTYGGPPGSESSLTEVSQTSTSRQYQISLADSKKIINLPHINDYSGLAGIETQSIHLEGSDKYYPAQIQAIEISSVSEVDLSAGRNLLATDKYAIILSKNYVKAFGLSSAELINKKVLLTITKDNYNFNEDPEIRQRYPQYFNKEGQGGIPEYLWKQLEQEYRQHPDSKEISLTIVGINSSSFDITTNYVPISLVNEIYKYKYNEDDHLASSGYNSIILAVDSEDNVDAVSESIQDLGFSAQSIKQMLEGILNMFTMVEAVLAVFGAIALFVAMIGIINTMIMSIYERTREIGVMRATGASRANIFWLFNFEAAALGFWGGVFGILLGIGLQKLISLIMDRYVLSGMDTTTNPIFSFGADALFQTPIWLIVLTITFTTFMGLVAGFFPANRASKLEPVDALKYE